MGEPEIQDQHIVSKVLLKRWASDGRISAYDVRFGSVKLRSPAAEGFITGFTKYGTAAFEARWSKIEGRMPKVFAALDEGSLLESPDAVETLKDLFALHFSRSRTVREVFRKSAGGAVTQLLEETSEIFRNPERLAQGFFERTGLHAAGPEARLLVQEAYLAELERRFGDGSEFFGERLDAHFEKVRGDFDGLSWGLQIGEAEAGSQFVIGDDPVQTVDSTTGAVGILAGVTIPDADAFLMPLGPRHVVSVFTENEVQTIPAHGVDRLNRIQIITAHEKVYFQPGSGLEDAIKRELAKK